MKDFQVHLKIKKQRGAHFEFEWMKDELRSPKQEIDLIIQGESEMEVYDIVLEQSKNTLEIVEIFTPDKDLVDRVTDNEKELDNYAAQYYELCMTLDSKDIIALTSNSPATIGHN